MNMSIFTVEKVKEEANSYQVDGKNLSITDKQAEAILDCFFDDMEDHFYEFVKSFILDGGLEELEELE